MSLLVRLLNSQEMDISHTTFKLIFGTENQLKGKKEEREDEKTNKSFRFINGGHWFIVIVPSD